MHGPVALEPAAALQTFERGKTFGVQGEKRQPQQIDFGLQGPRLGLPRWSAPAKRRRGTPLVRRNSFPHTASPCMVRWLARTSQKRSVLKVIEGYKGCRRKKRRFHGFGKPKCLEKSRFQPPTLSVSTSRFPRVHPPTASFPTSHDPSGCLAVFVPRAFPGKNLPGCRSISARSRAERVVPYFSGNSAPLISRRASRSMASRSRR